MGHCIAADKAFSQNVFIVFYTDCGQSLGMPCSPCRGKCPADTSPHLCLCRSTSRKKATGFAAVHQLFTERWPTTPTNRSVTGTTTERNIDFELDIRVEIDCGKCVLHPTMLQQEHDDISLRR